MTSKAATEATTVAVDFANIGYDTDDARPDLSRWARERLQSAALDARSLDRLDRLHTAVGAVLGGRIDDEMRHRLDAVALVNRASSATPVSPVLVVATDGSVAAGTAQPVRDLASLLAEISRSAIDVVTSSADRLRRCEGPGCGRYFLRDRSHRNWCSLGCGNRARVARHYARHTTTQTPTASSGPNPTP